MQKILITLALCFFSFILWAIYSANTGQSNALFKLAIGVPYGDKVGHFVLFGLLTLFANLAMQCKKVALGRFSVYWGSLAVLAFVTIEELSQHFLPTRTLDLYDYIADLAGIILFSGLSTVYHKLYLAYKVPS